jgi:hypothetical protein
VATEEGSEAAASAAVGLVAATAEAAKVAAGLAAAV